MTACCDCLIPQAEYEYTGVHFLNCCFRVFPVEIFSTSCQTGQKSRWFAASWPRTRPAIFSEDSTTAYWCGVTSGWRLDPNKCVRARYVPSMIHHAAAEGFSCSAASVFLFSLTEKQKMSHFPPNVLHLRSSLIFIALSFVALLPDFSVHTSCAWMFYNPNYMTIWTFFAVFIECFKAMCV